MKCASVDGQQSYFLLQSTVHICISKLQERPLCKAIFCLLKSQICRALIRRCAELPGEPRGPAHPFGGAGTRALSANETLAAAARGDYSPERRSFQIAGARWRSTRCLIAFKMNHWIKVCERHALYAHCVSPCSLLAISARIQSSL